MFRVCLFLLSGLIAFGPSACAIDIWPQGEETTGSEEESKARISRARQLLRATNEIKEQWANTKDSFSDKFESKISQHEEKIESLELAMDFGDPELRQAIRSQISELQRSLEALGELNDELRAVHGVGLAYIRSRLERMLEDWGGEG